MTDTYKVEIQIKKSDGTYDIIHPITDITQEDFENMFSEFNKKQNQKPISSWAEEAMNWVINANILQGASPGNYQTQGYLTREMCLTFMYRMYNAFIK